MCKDNDSCLVFNYSSSSSTFSFRSTSSFSKWCFCYYS